MKKIIPVLFIPLLLLLLAGCISSGEEITVNRDGSGRLVQIFKIKKDFVGFLNMSNEPSDPNLINLDELTSAAARMGEGVVFEKVEPMSENSPYAGYKAYYTFEDVSALNVSSSPSVSPEAGERDFERRIRFDFTPGNPASLTIIMPPEENDGEKGITTGDGSLENHADEGTPSTPQENEEMGDQLKQIYKDMHYWIILKVDGKIIETNARHVKNSTITVLDMSFDKIVDNDELFAKITGDDTGNINEYMEELSAAGVLIEDQERIRVSF